MYSLIEYSSNYSKTTGSLWFYKNTDNFKSFKYKAKLIRNTVANGANGILRNATMLCH